MEKVVIFTSSIPSTLEANVNAWLKLHPTLDYVVHRKHYVAGNDYFSVMIEYRDETGGRDE